MLMLAGPFLLGAQPQQPPAAAGAQAQSTAAPAQAELRPITYVLGPNDQVLIRAFDVEELNEKAFRVESDGYINLPLVGRIQAAGLTVQQFEAALVEQLKKYVRAPQVSVSIAQFRSEPVFMLGAFKAPGLYSLHGRRTLVEMMSSIGGLQPNASQRIRVTRHLEWGVIPLPNAVVNESEHTSTVDISLKSLMENVNAAEDIELKPYDTVRAFTAERVYVTGDLGKVGAYELNERESISVTQLLALAGGLGRDADPSKAKVLRPILDTARRGEIPIDVKSILQGKAADFPLMPNDVLYIPSRKTRAVWVKNIAIYAIPPLVTSLIITVLR
jgi:polysaccharide export outer membrane protein